MLISVYNTTQQIFFIFADIRAFNVAKLVDIL